MSEKRSFLRAASVVAAITAVSRVLGLVREAIIGALFGARNISDVFWIAFELPNLARRVLGEGSLSAFIVPLFSAERRERGDAGGWRYASNVLTAITLLTAALTVIGCLFAKPLFLIFGGFGMSYRGEAEMVALGAQLTRVMFPYLMLLSVSALLMGLCHSLRQFAAPAFGSILINVSMIAVSALFWLNHREQLGLAAGAEAETLARQYAYWLAISVLIGIVLRVGVHVPGLWKAGFRFSPMLRIKEPRLVELFQKMPWAVAGMAVAHVMISINKLFASFMGEGYVTHLHYASRLMQLPLGILAAAVGTAILPQLTQFLQEDRRDELRDLFGFAMRLLTLLFLPATVGLIVLGEPIVGLLFERFQWTAEATRGTYWALLFFSLGLVPAAGLRLVIPLYYARLDLRSPVWAGIAAVVVNIALNFGFFYLTDLKQGGLALATSLSLAVNLALLMFWMRSEVGGSLDRRLAATVWKSLLASLIMGLACWALREGFEAGFGQASFAARALCVAVGAPFGAALYFAIAAALKAPDITQAIDLLRRRLARKSPTDGDQA